MNRICILSAALLLILFSVTTAASALSGGATMAPAAKSGVASMYGKGSFQTASGRTVDSQTQLFSAHKSLPFGAKVKISRGARSVIVVIVDRSPYIAGRDFDLSYRAAAALNMVSAGVATIRYQVLSR